MYETRDRPRTLNSGIIELSQRDREDAARLLALLLGEEVGRRDRLADDPVVIASSILADRKRRADLFNRSMFGEPAWELLLVLFIMDTAGPRLTIGRLVQLAGTAMTTTLRWLDYLQDQGLVRREEHPTDARTAFVELTDTARKTLTLYLSGTVTSRA